MSLTANSYVRLAQYSPAGLNLRCWHDWVSLSSLLLRQLEAVVRIAESLAKMKLQPVAGEEEVDEALRLFQVSTLDAALSGSLSGRSACLTWQY